MSNLQFIQFRKNKLIQLKFWTSIPTPFEVSNQVDVTTKVDALSRKIDQLMGVGFAPTTTSHTPIQHEAYSFCFSPLHHGKDCPTVGQFYDISNEKVNVALSRPGNDFAPNFSW
jgi:hypothetical protein